LLEATNVGSSKHNQAVCLISQSSQRRGPWPGTQQTSSRTVTSQNHQTHTPLHTFRQQVIQETGNRAINGKLPFPPCITRSTEPTQHSTHAPVTESTRCQHFPIASKQTCRCRPADERARPAALTHRHPSSKQLPSPSALTWSVLVASRSRIEWQLADHSISLDAGAGRTV
jgi:hypothetical protein